jgi:hypothetical protein
MILCLDIMRGTHECLIPETDKLQAIQRSRAIWAEVVDDCRDAKRAVSILTSVLKKLSSTKEEHMKSDPIPETKEALSASATNPSVDTLRYSPYFTDQFGLGMPFIASQPTDVDTHMGDDFLDTLGSDLNMPGDFNWVCCHTSYCDRFI